MRERSLPFSFVKLSTQFDNAGDCLINRELVRLLAERGNVCLDLSACPAFFADQIVGALPRATGIRVSRWPFYLHLVRERLRGSRCYWFLMPGGITGQPPPGRLAHWIRDLPLPIAAALGIRVCLIGASFASLSKQHLAIWRRRQSWLFRLSPRDTESARYLDAHGIRHAACIPDLAFNLFRDPPFNSQPQADRDSIGCLSFRTDQFERQAADISQISARICREIGAETHWQTLVQVGRDRSGMEELTRQLRAAGIRIDAPVDCHQDVEACLAFYRHVSVVVSNRLHVLLMAASQGARIIALTAGPGAAKLDGILDDLGFTQAALLRDSQATADGGGKPSIGHSGAAMRRVLEQSLDELLDLH